MVKEIFLTIRDVETKFNKLNEVQKMLAFNKLTQAKDQLEKFEIISSRD